MSNSLFSKISVPRRESPFSLPTLIVLIEFKIVEEPIWQRSLIGQGFIHFDIGWRRYGREKERKKKKRSISRESKNKRNHSYKKFFVCTFILHKRNQYAWNGNWFLTKDCRFSQVDVTHRRRYLLTSPFDTYTTVLRTNPYCIGTISRCPSYTSCELPWLFQSSIHFLPSPPYGFSLTKFKNLDPLYPFTQERGEGKG